LRRIAAAAEQNHFLGDNLGIPTLVAVFIVKTVGAQPAFDVHLFALGQKVGEVFTPPKNDVMPIGLVLPFAGLLILEPPRGRDRKGGTRHAARREFRFGVPAEIAEENHFVDAASHTPVTLPQRRASTATR